jgi:hypothetical protein
MTKSPRRFSTRISLEPLGSILYNHTVPPRWRRGTIFASMYVAYDALSPRMQSYLSDLTGRLCGMGLSLRRVAISEYVWRRSGIIRGTRLAHHVH